MGSAGVAAVVVASPGNVAFLGGHVVPAQLAHPSRDGRLEKPTICIAVADDQGPITIGNQPLPTLGAASPYGEGGRGLNDQPAAFGAVADAAVSLDLVSGRVAVEGSYVPAAAVEALRERAPKLEIEPLDDLLKTARAGKSPAELGALSEALALCDAGQDAVRAATAAGRSELDLYAVAVEAMNGPCERQVLSLGEIQVGRRGEQMAGFPTSARVREGELVMCDLVPRTADGWWGDSCMTVACGDASAEAKRDWSKLRDALEAAREMLRPGVAAGDVHAAVEKHLPGLPGHAGHGIGRDHYEEPLLLAGNPEPLQADSVVVVEPGIYGDGRGMRIEHAFRISEDGGVPLSNFSLEL
jgi:Xaa-Pro aminopeptidase